jgi:hypothetical protein
MLVFAIYSFAVPSPARSSSSETTYKIATSFSIPSGPDYSSKDHFPTAGFLVFVLIALLLIRNYIPSFHGRKFIPFRERNHFFCNASINAP